MNAIEIARLHNVTHRTTWVRLIVLMWIEKRRLSRDAERLRQMPDYLLDDLGLTRDGTRRPAP